MLYQPHSSLSLFNLLLPKQSQNGGLRSRFFKTNFFRIAANSEAKTSVSGKAECLLTVGVNKQDALGSVTGLHLRISRIGKRKW